MRRILTVLAVLALSMPLIFVLWLLAAVHAPSLDAMTRAMPQELRASVAAEVFEDSGWGKQRAATMQRVLRLDPNNKDAVGSLCAISEKPAEAIVLCNRAVLLRGKPWDYFNLGRAQRGSGEPCPAEESFTKASSLGSQGTDYSYVEAMGRAALWCGESYNAKAGLAAAIDLEGKSLVDTSDMDAEDIESIKTDRKSDEEYLVVTLDRLHSKDEEQKTCSAAHPEWKSCACAMNTKGEVECAESR